MTDSMLDTVTQNADKVFFPFLGQNNIFTNGIHLNRVFFTIPGINLSIYWYGFLIGTGALLAMIFAYRKFIGFGINPDKAIDCVIGGLIGAIVGARLYYVIFSWSNYVIDGKVDWMSIISTRDGGLAIYGGLIGGLLVGGFIAKLHKIRLAALFDLAALGFLIGQAMGRWGNFVNQEAYGSLTNLPWGMTSSKIINEMSAVYTATPINDLVVHPCFLYESLWCVLGFVLLNIYLKHRKFDGEIFLLYSAWYGIGRAFIEGLRTDSLYIPNTSVRVSQLLAVVCVIVAFAIIMIVRIKLKENSRYKFFYETEVSIKSIEAYKNQKKKGSRNQLANADLTKAIDGAFDDSNKAVDEDEININQINDNDDDNDGVNNAEIDEMNDEEDDNG